MLEGVKLARDFARSPDLASLFAGELTPGDAVADDSDLAAFIAGNLATYYHPSSTAPMGGPPTRRPSSTRSAPSGGPADCGSSMPRSSPTPRPRSSTSPS